MATTVTLEQVEELALRLPPHDQLKLAARLSSAPSRKSRGPLRQTWAGALRDLRDQYTSLELQDLSNRWRND